MTTVIIKGLDGSMGRAEVDVDPDDLPAVLTASDGTTAEFTGDWVGRFDGPPWPVFQVVAS